MTPRQAAEYAMRNAIDNGSMDDVDTLNVARIINTLADPQSDGYDAAYWAVKALAGYIEVTEGGEK